MSQPGPGYGIATMPHSRTIVPMVPTAMRYMPCHFGLLRTT